jgi:spermidine/putrescine-binding protein
MWNAEAVIAKEYNPNIEIIYPKEGFAISLDNYTIVKGAKNIENSYKFINYLLRDDVNSKITEEYPYINTTNNNMNLGYEELEMVLNKASFVENIGSSISDFDKVWAEIK